MRMKSRTHPSSETSGVNIAKSGAAIAAPVQVNHVNDLAEPEEKLLTHACKIAINDAERDDAGQVTQSNHTENEHGARKCRNYDQV